MFAGLADTGLFAARGSTESVGPPLGILAVSPVIAEGIFLQDVPKKPK